MVTFFRAIIFQLPFVFALGGAAVAQSEPGKAAQSEFDKAVANYRQVVDKGDYDATEEAIKMFQSVLSKDPAEYRAMVYSGSLTTRLAKLAWAPWNKLKHVNGGIDMMDKGVEAVDKSNKDPQVVIESHMIRGITSARIPKQFKREAVAVADFKLIRNHPAFDKTNNESRVRVLAYSAVLSHRQEDAAGAAKFLSMARSINPEAAEQIWAER